MKRELSPADLAALRDRAEAVRALVKLSDVIGADVKLTKSGAEHDGLCPFHHDRNVGAFKVNDGKGFYKCFSCGASGDVIDYLVDRKGLKFIEALRQLEAERGIDFRDAKQKADFDRHRERREREEAAEADRKRQNAWYLWKHSAPLKGTPAQQYLEGRGIDFERLGKLPGAIRYRHDCSCAEVGRKLPAMVTAMIDGEGRHVATHRTYLEYRDGRWVKARLDAPKKILGSFRAAHIPIHKGAEGVSLAKAARDPSVRASEGIEDALTIAMADPTRRVIAAASLDNLGGLALPEAITAIELIAQRDPIGSAADERFQVQIGRLQATGRRVSILWPGEGFKDFNDQLLGKRMMGAAG